MWAVLSAQARAPYYIVRHRSRQSAISRVRNKGLLLAGANLGTLACNGPANAGRSPDQALEPPIPPGLARRVAAGRTGRPSGFKENIAVNKVCAILGRLEAKDYIDLMFLIRDRGFSILDLIEKGKKKDGGMEAFTFAQIIGDVENLSVLPRMRKPLSIDELRGFFRDLRVAILRAIPPLE